MGKLKLYVDYFKDKWFQKKEAPQIDKEELKQELWKADFSKPEKARFIEENKDDYVSSFTTVNGTPCYSLKAKRKQIFSWSLNPFYRYQNFVMEAELDMSNTSDMNIPVQDRTGRAGHFASGFVFRYLNDGVFYSVLISDYGWVRLDAMFNDNLMPVMSWIKINNINDKSSIKLKVIAIDDKITVLVNDEWIMSCQTDIIQASGKIGFAVQNWDSYPSIEVFLKNFSIISDPLLIEADDSAATQKSNNSPDAHFAIAETYYSMGKYVPALLELKHSLERQEPKEKHHILAGKIYFSQKMFEEAEEEFKKCIQLNPENYDAIAELSGIYYYKDEYKKLEKLLKPIKQDVIKNNPLLANFMGHLFHQKGEFEKSAEYYHFAFEASANNGLFAYNEANELFNANQKEQAIQRYIDAGHAFLKSEEYNDLAKVVNQLEQLAGDLPETLLIKSKFYYAIEQYDKAFEDLQKLCEDIDIKDASAWYLYGLMLKDEDSKTALKAFKKAFKLDPEQAFYAFRIAETEYFDGKDCSKMLNKALELDPEYPWSHNLSALCALDEDNFEEAESEIQKARQLLPDDIDILSNYIEIKRLQGQLDECIPMFDVETADLAVEKNRGLAYQVIANALYDDCRFDDAEPWYNKAMKLCPNDPVLMTNKAQNCLEIGLLNEADTLLVKAVDIEPTVDIYRTLAHVAAQKGTFSRAVAALEEGLSIFKNEPDLLFDLAVLQKQKGEINSAIKTFVKLKAVEKSERVVQLAQELSKKQ